MTIIPYQESCSDEDIYCHMRNLERLLDAVNENLEEQIDDQTDTIESDIQYASNVLLNNIDDIVRDELELTALRVSTALDLIIGLRESLTMDIGSVDDSVTSARTALELDHDIIIEEIEALNGNLVDSITGMGSGVAAVMDESFEDLKILIDDVNNVLSNTVKQQSDTVILAIEGTTTELTSTVGGAIHTITENSNNISSNILNASDMHTREIKLGINDTRKYLDNSISELGGLVIDQSNATIQFQMLLWEDIRNYIDTKLDLSEAGLTDLLTKMYKAQSASSYNIADLIGG